MARRRHEALSTSEAEALQASYDEAAKKARTAVEKDKISNLESLARTAEEAHKDRDLRAVYQVIRRLAPPARLPTRTVRRRATGEPCRHKQDEMDKIEKAMSQLYKGTSRPLDGQAPCSATLSSTAAAWQAPDVTALSRAIMRLPNFKAAPKIFFRRPPRGHQHRDDQRKTLRNYTLAGCYAALCETGSLPQALKDGKITRRREPKGTGENAAEDYRNISILEHRGIALVGAQLQPLMRTLQANLDPCQTGEVVRRSTRDAIALADEIIRRYRLQRRRQRPARRACGQRTRKNTLSRTRNFPCTHHQIKTSVSVESYLSHIYDFHVRAHSHIPVVSESVPTLPTNGFRGVFLSLQKVI